MAESLPRYPAMLPSAFSPRSSPAAGSYRSASPSRQRASVCPPIHSGGHSHSLTQFIATCSSYRYWFRERQTRLDRFRGRPCSVVSSSLFAARSFCTLLLRTGPTVHECRSSQRLYTNEHMLTCISFQTLVNFHELIVITWHADRL